MLDEIRRILQDECHLDPARTILVGVSGGPDSLCTMDILARLGYPLALAHFNHKLRPEADRDLAFVERLAEDRKIKFLKGEDDVNALAEQWGQSIEEAARNARYRFLFSIAERLDAQAIAVGHSADDQVETVLMHLLRGAGMDGLRGMSYRSLPNAWSDEIPLVRPLLGVWREEIMTYCQEQGLDPIMDATNKDTTFFRNRLRHELLPVLEDYNPAIRMALWRSAEVLRGDDALIAQEVETAWRKCLLAEGPGYVSLNPHKAGAQILGVQRRLVRRALTNLRPGIRDIGFETVELVRDYFTGSAPPAEIDLTAGLKLLSEPGRIWLADWEADLPVSEWPQITVLEAPLLVPGSLILPNGWTISVEKPAEARTAVIQAQNNPDPYRAWIDASQTQEPLNVRSRREGDRFQPLGMKMGSIKLSDFMINEKIPRRVRAGWPLICCGDQIVWVVGYRIAHPFRVSEDSRDVLNLEINRKV